MKTVFLPQTKFPIRAAHSEFEPKAQQRWRAIDLHVERAARGGKPFVLHDGPPYANGNIHIGHALNKILKDFAVRTRYLLGCSVSFTPGWDCHGLPIETGVEKAWREEGRDKNADPKGFRDACRAYATDWVWQQGEQFERLGVLADWGHHYETMSNRAVAETVRALHELAARKLVYTARRPVLWSALDRTGLAKNETEEREHQVDTTWLLFPFAPTRKVGKTYGTNPFLLVWTTTPWSLPGNTALAINYRHHYGVYDFNGTDVIMARFAASQFPEAAFKKEIPATEICEHQAVHPLYPDKRVPIYDAPYVQEGKGSGIVHVGPASSVDDWQLWTKYNGVDTVPEFIGSDGRYLDSVPLFGGMQVVKNKGFGEANAAVIEALGDYLVRVDTQVMTLLHSERSGGLLIENASPQWFVDVSSVTNAKIDDIVFHPEQARNRFESMLRDRGDWLISRQRLWGTPLALFVNNAGEVLDDPALYRRVADTIEREGSSAWWTTDFHQPESYHKVTDVLDVWFDSGCVHRFFGDLDHYLEQGGGLRSRRQLPVADLYLEGSDQHRGWFQSSLMVSYLTKGRAPFKELLTHGFVLDPTGKKQSKSKGNVTDLQKLVSDHGADVVRLWVAMTDYRNDIKVGKDLKATEEVYRKIRNTVRYLLGALDGYTPDKNNFRGLAVLDEYMLHCLSSLLGDCKDALADYDFTKYMTALHEFCVHDLSSLYFDVRKDRLYCDPLADEGRLATLETMSVIFDVLVPLLAPILVHTAEEAWLTRYPDATSVHLERWPEFEWGALSTYVINEPLKTAAGVRPLLDQATKDGTIKKSGEAVLRGDVGQYPNLIKELLMVADVIPDGGPPRVENAANIGYSNCERCRIHQVELAGEFCARCETAMEDFRAG